MVSEKSKTFLRLMIDPTFSKSLGAFTHSKKSKVGNEPESFVLRVGILTVYWLFAVCGCSKKIPVDPLDESSDTPAHSTTNPPLEMISGSSAGGKFETLSEADRMELGRLIAAFRKCQNNECRFELMERIGNSYSGRELVAFAQEVLKFGDPELSLAAVEMLSGNSSVETLPVLEDALASPSVSVRQAAAAAAGHIGSPEVVEFFGKVFADPSEEVRLTGMLSLDEQRPVQRLNILDRALKSPYPDVQVAGIGDLQVDSSRRSVEVMFQALDSALPEVKEEARFVIDFLIDKEFSNAAEARAWWSQNRQRFDNDLVPLD
jgi:hypothetical protein